MAPSCPTDRALIAENLFLRVGETRESNGNGSRCSISSQRISVILGPPEHSAVTSRKVGQRIQSDDDVSDLTLCLA